MQKTAKHAHIPPHHIAKTFHINISRLNLSHCAIFNTNLLNLIKTHHGFPTILPAF